ncbi:MAG: type III-D CRISPR-associated protein Csx19 [Desulfurispora sp.]|uniref:type III-D CRISPR-associated protein Csx19 n=1 Tax=Desulfurispora sp. TaxID=3014275 RepID=UPI00404A2EDA
MNNPHPHMPSSPYQLGSMSTIVQTGTGELSTLLEKAEEKLLLESLTTSAGAMLIQDEGIYLCLFQKNQLYLPWQPGKTLCPNSQHLHSLRLFTPEQEFYIWAQRTGSGNVFHYRWRTEMDIKPNKARLTDYVDARQLLWGKVEYYDPKTGRVEMYAGRGIRFSLPAQLIKSQVKRGSPIWLHTRNYIAYNELGQAGYVDCRFIQFAAEVTNGG